MQTVKKLLFTAVGTAFFALSAGTAEAATVMFMTEGADSGINSAIDRNDFFQVSFTNGPSNLFIEQLTLDLSPDSDAFFDFGGGFFSPGGFGFPPALSNNSDIVGADIDNTVLSADLKTLTTTFVGGAFGVGETLEFGVDTDFVGPGIGLFGLIDPGAAFGLADITFSVQLSDGRSGTGTFEVESFFKPSKSVASVHIPEPTTVLALFTMGGLSAFSLKRSRH